MTQQLPVVDDTIVWDVYLSLYKVPALSVALELAPTAAPLPAPAHRLPLLGEVRFASAAPQPSLKPPIS